MDAQITDLTKIAGRLIGDVRDLVDWGVEGDHIDEQQLRLTIEARRAKVKELTEAGLSQRQTAKALGVSHTTVQHDLAENLPETAKKLPTKAERRAAREAELAAKQVALPAKKYGVILADPEWRFEPWSRETGLDKSADNHYPTSPLDVIKSRNVKSIAADDCVLFFMGDGANAARSFGSDGCLGI